MNLFRLRDSEPLAAYYSALASRLATILLEVLRDELTQSEQEARRLAGEVVWTVTREREGTWLNLAHGKHVIGVGGNRLPDEEGPTLYVRQMAHSLVGREEEFEP